MTFSLLILIGLELRKLRAARRAARAGARLHSRVVALFSLVAAIPALVTAVVATVSVEWAINPAFMKNVADFINESAASSRLYRESQCQSLLRDAELTAGDLAQSASLLHDDPKLFADLFEQPRARAEFRRRRDHHDGRRRRPTAEGSDRKLIARPAAADFADAAARQPFCGLLTGGDVFIALRPIEGIDKSFFYAGRSIDPIAEKVARDADNVTAAFANFEGHRRNIELGFAIVFVMLSLTMLISAVWMGLTFANQLVGPIRRLIRATDEVASGNLYVQVPTRKSEGDLGHLGETFNKMTGELRRQHNP